MGSADPLHTLYRSAVTPFGVRCTTLRLKAPIGRFTISAPVTARA